MFRLPTRQPGEDEQQLYALIFRILIVCSAIIGIILVIGYSLPALLINDDTQATADAAIVLWGPRYDARVYAAGHLYMDGRVKRIVINGDRRSVGVERELGTRIRTDCGWDSRYRAILKALGVPDSAIIPLAIPTAFDTRSEARAVRERIAGHNFHSLIIVTDLYHTARARMIWRAQTPTDIPVYSAAARLDGDDPAHWWSRPSEIKRVLTELGGHLFALLS